MTVDNEHDLEALKEIGRICRDVLRAMGEKVRPGVSSLELDFLAGRMLEERGARSAPKLAYNFPGFTCISVGDVVAHGIPSEQPMTEGQLVNIDVSAEKGGYFADCGASFPVGNVPDEALTLLKVTKDAQRKGMDAARPGARISDIGKAVAGCAQKSGFTQIEGLHSHGVGRWIHEEPDIPTLYYPSIRKQFRHGDVITVEPFLGTLSRNYYQADDGWSLVLDQGGIGAQFEHSFVVTKTGPIVLTA